GTPINTIGFNSSPELADFSLPVELEPAGITNSVGRTVGVAIANANGSSATVTMTLRRADGTTFGSVQKTIPANGQSIFSLQNEFANLPNANFVGSLAITSTAPVSAIALEDDLGPFSSIPVITGHP